MADKHIIAVDTYGAQRIRHPHTGKTISAYKLGYTSAVTPVLLALYGGNARDVSPKQASYRYLQIDAEVIVRHGHILLTVSADELAKAIQITRQHHRAAVYLWRDQKWWALPDSTHADYTEPGYRVGANFDPTGFRPPSPSTGERESAVTSITAQRSQREEGGAVWWWLSGETYPHRELLKRHGARFSGRRKQWYYIGWELPPTIQALVSDEIAATPDTATMPPVMSAELQRQILDALAADEAAKHEPQAVLAETLAEEATPSESDEPPAIRVTKPTPFPADGESLDAVQTAIREAKTGITVPAVSSAAAGPSGRVLPIAQAYCGELTSSITGQVYCYGYAIHEGICIYVNMGGPRVGVEAIRAKLSKGDIVSVVPDDTPSVELTAGEGNSGMYTAYLHTIPEARFTSLILLHDWLVQPSYGGAATTFILRTSDRQAQAKLRQHVEQLVNLPVFEQWTPFLWKAGHAAMLVRPTRSAGGIDLLTVALDATAWTRLITGGVEQGVIALPDNP